ncbi:Uncharacterised protein [Mycobacterium tuberculosis]|uniref:Uncharacterized protein n=1 Tax=Mycobacterium tuberculosis TaxID=1773 RepID=A0A655FZ01_MYCTX|nr:Uncharacterised protein [Mycobacterium tuberculosis]CNW95499.1 Uncharacterised protein [Mycobacterium tuberculosis]CPA36466.1 Uncharacterised protein [Mycobacterium tuberculosis]
MANGVIDLSATQLGGTDNPPIVSAFPNVADTAGLTALGSNSSGPLSVGVRLRMARLPIIWPMLLPSTKANTYSTGIDEIRAAVSG